MDHDLIAKSRGYKNSDHENEMKAKEAYRQKMQYLREEHKKIKSPETFRAIKEHQKPEWKEK